MNTGWICPKCQKVWAPSMLECTACNCADHLRGGAIPYDPFTLPPFRVPPSSGDPIPMPTFLSGGIAVGQLQN